LFDRETVAAGRAPLENLLCGLRQYATPMVIEVRSNRGCSTPLKKMTADQRISMNTHIDIVELIYHAWFAELPIACFEGEKALTGHVYRSQRAAGSSPTLPTL
jgi:hypothetical protein